MIGGSLEGGRHGTEQECGASHGKQKRLLARAVVGMALCLVTASGCQGQSGTPPAVLTVGTYPVRLNELQWAFWDAQKKDQTLLPDTASLRRFIPTYADKVIWEELALEAIPTLSGTPQDRILDFKEELVVNQLRREAYLDAAQPSEAELRGGYDALGRELHLRYMLIGDRKEAEDLILVMRQGGVFAKIAPQKSLDERSRASAGDIGWVTFYDLDPDVRERVWPLKTDEIAGPIPSNGQWQIFQLVEERPYVGRGTFEAEEPRLRLGFLAGRAKAGRERFIEELLRKYEFKTDPAEIAWMTALLREKTASVPRDIGAFSPEELDDPEVRAQFSGNPFKTPPVAPADTGRVLATWNGPNGRVTPYLILDQLLIDAPLSWPKFERPEDVVNLARKLVIERLELREAEQRKIDQRPEIQARVAVKEREVRARYWYRTQLRPTTVPPEGEVRAYYDSHPQEFSLPERRRVLALNTVDQEVAREIQRLLREGRAPSEVTAELISRDPTLTGTGNRGTEFLAYGQSPLLDSVLFTLPLDGVSDPIPVQDRFTVAKVIEIAEAKTTPFEEAAAGIRSNINGQKTELLLQEKISAARPSYPVRVNEEALRRVQLKAPASW